LKMHLLNPALLPLPPRTRSWCHGALHSSTAARARPECDDTLEMCRSSQEKGIPSV
jgi:hypothetical protein